MRGILWLGIALLLSACGQVQHRTQLSEPVGQVKVASVGAPLVTIHKKKDLPNAFGGADIFGRKVNAGFTRIVFLGAGPDGSASLERVDVDVHSTATTMSRTPGILSAQSNTTVVGNAYGNTAVVSGQRQSSATAIVPIGETTTVLPSRSSRFSVPQGKMLTLGTGQTVEFLKVEPHQVTYRIVSPQS